MSLAVPHVKTEVRRSPAFKDISGLRFGGVVVQRYAGKSASRKSMWHVVCDCGFEFITTGNNLTTGTTQGCGCGNRRAASERAAKRNFKHGHAKGVTSPEYKSWAAMLSRCKYSCVKGYENYGGRGIKVCDRWADFKNFLADMGPRPKGHSLDRIDVNGNYEPGNCRWATARDQGLNKRNSRKAATP